MLYVCMAVEPFSHRDKKVAAPPLLLTFSTSQLVVDEITLGCHVSSQ